MEDILRNAKHFTDQMISKSSGYMNHDDINNLDTYFKMIFNKPLNRSCSICIKDGLYGLKIHVEQELAKIDEAKQVEVDNAIKATKTRK